MRDPNQVAQEQAAQDLLKKLGLNESLAKAQLGQDIANGPEQTHGIGHESFDEITQRYQKRGADLQNRTGPVLDETQANQSRAMQMSALDMLRRQGSGEAPSAAQVYAQRANQDAVMGAGRAVAGARTTGGALAALRASGAQAGDAMLAGNARNAAMRAGEISQGQGGYMQGSGTLRAGDISAATQNAQLEAQQRALNESAQQNYETMQRNARYAQQHAGQLAQGTHNQQVQDLAALEAAEQERERQVVGQVVSTGTSAASGGISAATAAARRKGGR